MQFVRHLRERIKSGEISTSIRIWKSPRVRVGARYRLDGGWIVIENLAEISLSDVTPELARKSGFAGVVDLLKTAKHGAGDHVYLVRFHYVEDD